MGNLHEANPEALEKRLEGLKIKLRMRSLEEDLDQASKTAARIFELMKWGWWNNDSPSVDDIRNKYEELLRNLQPIHGHRVHSGRLSVIFLKYSEDHQGEVEFYVGPVSH